MKYRPSRGPNFKSSLMFRSVKFRILFRWCHPCRTDWFDLMINKSSRSSRSVSAGWTRTSIRNVQLARAVDGDTHTAVYKQHKITALFTLLSNQYRQYGTPATWVGTLLYAPLWRDYGPHSCTRLWSFNVNSPAELLFPPGFFPALWFIWV